MQMRRFIISLIISAVVSFLVSGIIFSEMIGKTFHDAAAFWTFILCIVTMVLTIATILLWYTTKAGLLAQGNDTRKALVAGNRAWIKITMLPCAHVALYKAYLTGNLSVSIENYGNAPATYVHIYLWPFIPNCADADAKKWQIQMCDSVRNQKNIDGILLFPKEVYPGETNGHKRGWSGPFAALESIEKGLEFGRLYSQNGFVLKVCVCVNYSFPSDTKNHQTRMLLNLTGRNGGWISLDEVRASGPWGVDLQAENLLGEGDHAD